MNEKKNSFTPEEARLNREKSIKKILGEADTPGKKAAAADTINIINMTHKTGYDIKEIKANMKRMGLKTQIVPGYGLVYAD